MLLRGSSLPLFAAGLAGDAMLNATRLYLSYLTAVDASNRDAPKVADAIATSSLTRDYRIVAHSLGCRLIVDALPLLPPESRPSEIHLCAAALTANHALPKLDSICRPGGRIYHYWSSHDEALSSAFLLASRGEPALGSMPLPNDDKPLSISTSSHDVSSYLGLASHGQRFVQTVASSDEGRSWGRFEFVRIDGYEYAQGDVYFFAVSVNPVGG